MRTWSATCRGVRFSRSATPRDTTNGSRPERWTPTTTPGRYFALSCCSTVATTRRSAPGDRVGGAAAAVDWASEHVRSAVASVSAPHARRLVRACMQAKVGLAGAPRTYPGRMHPRLRWVLTGLVVCAAAKTADQFAGALRPPRVPPDDLSR